MQYRFLLFFIVINNTVAFSQVKQQFGLLLGFNKSQIIGDDYPGYRKSGFCAGAFARLPLTDRSLLELDLFISNEGCASKPYKDGNRKKYDYFNILYYVKMPILYRYTIKKYFFEMGAGVGLLVWHLDYESNPTKYLERDAGFLDLNANTGIGYTFNKYTSLGIRYVNSVKTIRKFPTNQYNSVFQLFLSYTIISVKK